MTAVFCDIYLFSISTLFKILGCATSSYVGSVLKKSCQKAATGTKGSARSRLLLKNGFGLRFGESSSWDTASQCCTPSRQGTRSGDLIRWLQVHLVWDMSQLLALIISNLNNQLFPTTHLRLDRVLHPAHPWQLINVTPSKALISLIEPFPWPPPFTWIIVGGGISIMEGGGSKCC